jgi:hypothetical protein
MKPLLAVILLLLGAWTACLKAPRTRVESRPPDEILFDRARSGVAVQNLDLAHMTFQTLMNTYPNSPNGKKAREALKGPQIANCAGVGSVPRCETLEDTTIH